ncbi:hypothetical protein Nepgr_028099 [Nepenthes gracilis]|uniref:Leucine zipper homeobox-associated domain-containing protein n=1 Tax=Nepenthes gracilis TaxID=150966 RepID=A0AAD3TCI2_NEPGR|nr:hypothetical protein Nepgr_028099 [Nepenthes gracilis]
MKQMGLEFEYLQRWFRSLTEQNRRLHREVEELRAMKVAPPTVLSPHSRHSLPASTLTMCPRCESISAASTRMRPAVVAAAAAPPATSSSPKVTLVHAGQPSAGY